MWVGLCPSTLPPLRNRKGRVTSALRGRGGGGDGDNKAWPRFAKVQVVSSSGTEVRDTSLAPYLIQGVDGLPWLSTPWVCPLTLGKACLSALRPGKSTKVTWEDRAPSALGQAQASRDIIIHCHPRPMEEPTPQDFWLS